MTKSELVFEIHKVSPMYSTKKLNQMNEETLQNLYNWAIKPSKVIKPDNSLYDTKGNKVTIEEEVEDEVDVLEPYDPTYMEETYDGNPYHISASEKKFLRKVSILRNKLRSEGVPCEWIERWQCFQVERYLTDYPTYRYLRVNVEENDYSFGTEKEDLVYDGKVSVVVKAAKKWINSKLNSI